MFMVIVEEPDVLHEEVGFMNIIIFMLARNSLFKRGFIFFCLVSNYITGMEKVMLRKLFYNEEYVQF